LAPEVLQLNEEGIAQVIASSEELKDSIEEAIDECPVECIHWEDC
jgi:ferredoxin